MASGLGVDTIVGCTDVVLAFTEGEDSADAMDDPGRHTRSVPMSVHTSDVRAKYRDSPPGTGANTRQLSQG